MALWKQRGEHMPLLLQHVDIRALHQRRGKSSLLRMRRGGTASRKKDRTSSRASHKAGPVHQKNEYPHSPSAKKIALPMRGIGTKRPPQRWPYFFDSKLESAGSSTEIVAAEVGSWLYGSLGTILFMVVEHRLRSDKPLAAVPTLLLLTVGSAGPLRALDILMHAHGCGKEYRTKAIAPSAGAPHRLEARLLKVFHVIPPVWASARSDARAWHVSSP